MDIYDYTTSGGKNLIKEYIEKLPNPLKVEIFSVRQLIREKGIEAFALLATRQLYKKLWEIRISQKSRREKRKNRNWRKQRNGHMQKVCYKGSRCKECHL